MQKRYISLDILRGLTIACMVMVNNPGSSQYRYAPLRHSVWSGCTVCDLVFPFFLFCAGMAMAFSLSGFTRFSADGAKKVLRRGSLIFLIGLILNMIPFPEHVRIFGVLQRIGICYIVGGLLVLWLQKPKWIVCSMVLLMVTHWLILRFAGASPGWDTLEGNISGPIDIAVVGVNHVYKGYGIPFDPEGLLGVLSATGTLLLGFLAGRVVRSAGSAAEASASIFAISALCLALGRIWNIWLPINKPMWTGSYVLYSGGWALFVLGLLIYLTEVRGWTKPFAPFRIFGMNSLVIFIASGLVYRIFGRIIHWSAADGSVITPLKLYYNNCCAALLGDGNSASLAYALTMVLLMFLLALLLYRRNIVIKL